MIEIALEFLYKLKKKKFQNKSVRKKMKLYNEGRKKEKRSAFCWAPFTSVRFHRNGCVQVCCHHIEYISLQNQTLKEIWFGSELKTLRQQMKKYAPPPACNFCASNYMAGNFNNVNALAYDEYEVPESGYPVFMDFSLSNTCNLNCVMCDASLSSGVQKAKKITSGRKEFIYNDAFLAQLDEFIPHLKRTIFTGGEPFMIDFYFKLWDRILNVNRNTEIYVTTNGTIYNQKTERLLNRGKFNITVSVDSFEKETYEKIRAGAQYEKTLDNIKTFAAYCKHAGTQFTVIVCPMQLNRNEIPDIVKRCNENNWYFTYNVLRKPFQLALWSLDYNTLDNYVGYLKAQTFPPKSNDIHESNEKKYQAYIHLMESWCRLRKEIMSAGTEGGKRKANENRNTILAYYKKLYKEKGGGSFDMKRVAHVLESLPDILFTDAFRYYLENPARNIFAREFELNDDDTIVDHLTIVGFNILYGEASLFNE